MVTDGNRTYCDYFKMYRNNKSLLWVRELT